MQHVSVGKIQGEENSISNFRAKGLRQTILYVNNLQINRLKEKLHNLCTDSRWKKIDSRILVYNISNIKLSINESLVQYVIGLQKKMSLLQH